MNVAASRAQFVHVMDVARRFLAEARKPAPALMLQDIDANIKRLDRLMQRASEERAMLFMSRLAILETMKEK